MRDAFRKARLSHLIAKDYGSRPAFLAAHPWISKSRLSQVLGKTEPFAEDAALAWEKRLDLPAGWFSNEWPTPKEQRFGAYPEVTRIASPVVDAGHGAPSPYGAHSRDDGLDASSR